MSAKGTQLTTRDRVLLETLSALRVMTTRQVQRLLFPSEQIALRRLRRLVDAGYLRSELSTVSPHRLVWLTNRGWAVVGMEGQTHDGLERRSALFLQHQLGINGFRLTLGLSCVRRPEFELLRFVSDGDAVSGQVGVQPQRVLRGVLGHGAHIPDGMFALRRGDRTALFFFEYDRGTEVIGNPARGFGRIIHSYLQAFTADTTRRAAKLLGIGEDILGFRVLVVTTTPARIANIRRRWAPATGVPSTGRRLIWLAGADALDSDDLLAKRWVPLAATDSRTYAIAGDPA